VLVTDYQLFNSYFLLLPICTGSNQCLLPSFPQGFNKIIYNNNNNSGICNAHNVNMRCNGLWGGLMA